MPNTTAETRMVRKPYDLARVLKQMDTETIETVAIEETVTLTTAEYDAFVEEFFQPRPWLAGRGGFRGEMRLAIQVTAPKRTTLFVDPSGSDYARYVGVVLDRSRHRKPSPHRHGA